MRQINRDAHGQPRERSPNFRWILFVISLVIMGITAGCGSTVTQKDMGLSHISFAIETGVIANSSNTTLLIIFGSGPLSLPTIGDYITAPGQYADSQKFRIGYTLFDYYRVYFSTWSDYMWMGQQSGVFNGPFRIVSESDHSNFRPRVTGKNPWGNKSVLIDCDRAELSVEGNRTELIIVSIDPLTSQIVDIANVGPVGLDPGTTLSVDDPSVDTDVPPALDITHVSLTVR